MNAQQLKASILQMAIEGRLVPQDPEDKPVDIDTKDIVPEEEQPFAIPKNWRWVRLGGIGTSNIGLTFKPTDVSKDEFGIPVLRSNNIQNGLLTLADLKRIEARNIPDKVFVQSGDLLICARNGSRKLVGKAAVIPDKLPEPMVFGAFMAIFRSKYNKYLFHFISSPYFRSFLDSVNTTTINQITQKNLLSILCPLPPLSEQKRIVTRIEELMPLIEAYGEAQTHLEKLDKELPDRMKQSILQTAIQGKLVPQDPNDKPVDIDSKDIVPKEEQPFAIPENWRWYTVSDCVEIGPRVNADDELEATFIPMAAISTGYDSKLENPEIKKWEKIKKGYSRFSNGDIIFARITPCFQNLKSTIVNNLKNSIGAGSTEFHVLRPSQHIYDKYLLYFLKSPYLLEYGKEHLQGTAGQQRFTREDLGRCCIPLPPVSEQKNIIILIEKLFKEIDEFAISM